MISLVDIQNKDFKKSAFRGYKVEDVNDFFEEVTFYQPYLCSFCVWKGLWVQQSVEAHSEEEQGRSKLHRPF